MTSVFFKEITHASPNNHVKYIFEQQCKTLFFLFIARIGLMHIGVFILLLLSGERNFGKFFHWFCTFFQKKITIFCPTSRACKTFGLVYFLYSLFSSKFHALSNGNYEILKCLVPEIWPVEGDTVFWHWYLQWVKKGLRS